MLRKFLAIFIISLVAFGLIINDAEARRFGGGRSFGASRSVSSFSRPSAGLGSSSFTRPGLSRSSWLGPLAGFAAGGLLSSLFFNQGFGGGIFSWLMIGGFIFMLISYLRSRMQSGRSFNQAYGENNHFARNAVSQFMQNNHGDTSNFNEETFLREAKSQFYRLQAAYDQKNSDDLREFTMPEVFAEIQLQWQERGSQENKTNVISLQAELLNLETQIQNTLASVRFSGLIQEDPQAPASNFNEIWHFKKDAVSSRWLVAGVQQS